MIRYKAMPADAPAARTPEKPSEKTAKAEASAKPGAKDKKTAKAPVKDLLDLSSDEADGKD